MNIASAAKKASENKLTERAAGLLFKDDENLSQDISELR
jgi:hypothetical protein